MFRSALLCVISLTALAAQDMKPLPMESLAGPSTGSARADWIRITNQRFQMSGKSTRVEAEGLTAVILAPDVLKPRHAKRMLLGKDEHALLFRSIVAEGFNRIVVRNPDTGKEWGAWLEQGKATLEF
jgi:hypothetical protein